MKRIFLTLLCFLFLVTSVYAEVDTLEGQATSGIDKWEGQTLVSGVVYDCSNGNLTGFRSTRYLASLLVAWFVAISYTRYKGYQVCAVHAASIAHRTLGQCRGF